jgi:hypothetical protein
VVSAQVGLEGQQNRSSKVARVEHAIQPATKADDHQSSYGLKHEYERETKCYVSNAQFKGAMLVAGYLPTKKGEQSWHFMILPMDNEQCFSHENIRQNNRGRVRTYCVTPPKEQDQHFNALIQNALASRYRG